LATLEGNTNFNAVTYSSGLSAVTALMFHLKPRRIFITLKEGYWGTHEVMALFEEMTKGYKSENPLELVDISTLDDYINTILANEQQQPNRYTGDLIWLETPMNPTCKMSDIAEYVEKAKKIKAMVAVDSTFASPILQQPLLLGVDFVFHSTTKFLGGHSDLLGGAIITNNENARSQLSRQRGIFGNVMGNMECWLLLRSLRTLELRVTHQSKTANEVALWLESQIDNEETNKRVTKVWYPLEKSHPDHYAICQKQMKGPPGILSVELDTAANARKLPTLLELFIHATSLGGYESLVDYRYMWDDNAPPGLLRLSIGLESSKDLIADLKYALLQLQ
jgi:cystathionine gamma-synthase